MTTILHGNVVPGVRRLKTKTAAAVAAAEDYLPTPRVARRYDVTTRTIERWEDDTKLRFPAPDLIVNTRKYWQIKTLEAWERSMLPRGPKRKQRAAKGEKSHEVI